MTNVSKKIQYLFIIGAMLAATPQKANAFGFFPPTPPEVVVDIPDDAGKIVSNINSAIRQLQTYYSKLQTLDLDKLKGMLDLAFSITKPKAVGRGEAKAATIGDTTIEKGSLSEEDYFNAYTQLFFVYPPAPEGENIPNTAMRTAYRHKGIEYEQDVLIDTYVTGRITEDYLAMVEKTVDRLGKCQSGQDTSNCKFFGMEFSEVPAISASPSSPEDNSGQLGITTNSYIITTMYDRLVRVIEDLTATEAIYKASRQNELVRPVSNNSDAADYINTKYKFAYHQTKDNAYAKGIVNKFKASDCENKDAPGCAQASHTKADIPTMDSAAILGKLQQIDQWQQNAVILHNLKVQLPEYKTLYRKYLKAKEVHKKALENLKQTDKCVMEFLDTYKTTDVKWDNSSSRWGNVTRYEDLVAKNNEYKDRGGLSAELIQEYQTVANETIMDLSESENMDDRCKAMGYHEKCSDGYVKDTTKHCIITKEVEQSDGTIASITIHENASMNPCLVDSVEMDTGEMESASDLSNLNASDYMKDNEAEDRIALEGRIQAEKTWRIGQEKLMALTKSGKLKFDPWNDQKDLQAMYLKKKYNNMKTIIEATDDAVNSFKIAANHITGLNYSGADSNIKDELQAIVKNASACISPINNGAILGHAKVLAFKEEAKVTACTGKENCVVTGINCTNAGNLSAGTATVTCHVSYDMTKYNSVSQYDEEGNYTGSISVPYTAHESTDISKTWTQHVNFAGSACELTQPGNTYDNFAEDTSCPGTWNLLPSFLVKNYFKAILGGCQTSLDNQAKFMHDNANRKYEGEDRGVDGGRIVAWDKLADVIDKRIENDEKVKEFVKKYNDKQTERKETLKREKQVLDNLNKEIDKVIALKNGANKQLKRSNNRIDAIGKEKDYLDGQKGIAKGDAQQCSLNVKIYQLEFESAVLKGEHAPVWGGSTVASCDKAREKNPAFEEDKKIIDGLRTSDYVIGFNEIYNDTENKKESRHVKLSEAELQVNLANTRLDGLKISRDAQKEKIEKIQEDITLAAQCFASPEDSGTERECNRKVPGSYSYIVVATESQEALDGANASYEKFIDGDARMQWTKVDKCTKRLFGRRRCEPRQQWAYDNLAATMTQYLYDVGAIEDKNSLKTAIQGIVQDDLRRTWTGDDKIGGIISALRAKNVPDNFYIKDFSGMVVPFANGPITVETVVKTFRDVVERYAVEQLQQEISNADTVIEAERNAAVQKIEDYMTQLGISDNSSEVNTAVFVHDNYKEGASMITNHNNLISALRRPAQPAYFDFVNGNMSTIWGIPENLATIDDDYFVGLPARGNNYTGKQECVKNAEGKVVSGDCNAGREFTAPKEPLLNLPPLREVFYFDAKDFDDLPRRGDIPTLTSFLNLKYKPSMDLLGINDADAKDWEYMPEIWRYLLARPNTRNDGLYQQTYVEDSYGDGAIKDLLERGNEKGYRALIGRGGVYPCALGGSMIDVAGGDGVRDMKFGKRYGNTSMACYEVKASGNKVIHLMADHKVKDVEDSEGLGNINNPSFSEYSELGQVLKFSGNRLRYRPLQKNIQEYMKSDKDDDNKNDITRRKAETATFKRNMFGSFIDAVNHEHNAKKNLDTIEQNVIDSLSGLCKQIHAQNMVVSATGENEETCVKFIMANGGLASSAEDRAYGTSQEYDEDDYNSLNSQGRGSYYYTLYYLLANKEAEMLNKAENGSAAPAPAEGEDPIMCGNKKNRYCGYRELLSAYGNDTDRVKERLDSIRRYFNALNGDAAEKVVTITPTLVDKLERNLLTANAAKSSMEGEIKNAKADRTLARIKDDEAIQSMENQGQIVPYCPIYRKR